MAPYQNQQHPQVLAASGNPNSHGHSTHLKSNSTSNTNYFNQLHSSQMDVQSSQGRTTEYQRKKQSESAAG